MAQAAPITSLQNPRVKNVVRLRNRRHRDELQQTVVEGLRESLMFLQSGLVPLEAFICPAYLDPPAGQELIGKLDDLAASRRTRFFEVPPAVFDKMAYRRGSGGILLVIPYQTITLDELLPGDKPLVVVVDGAEKPGNLGAILRSADAAGADALLLTADQATGTDKHNPNVIRASLGAFFTVPIIATTRDQANTWFRKHELTTVATTPDARQHYTAVSYDAPIAIVMGSEAQGLGDSWLQIADQQVHIPMLGSVDSLNLSVATAVILYEALRQRTLLAH